MYPKRAEIAPSIVLHYVTKQCNIYCSVFSIFRYFLNTFLGLQYQLHICTHIYHNKSQVS